MGLVLAGTERGGFPFFFFLGSRYAVYGLSPSLFRAHAGGGGGLGRGGAREAAGSLLCVCPGPPCTSGHGAVGESV
eukprot:scaffold4599_cov116-Isochrysis_galbana.AAC.2